MNSRQQKLTKEELAEKIKSWEKRAAMARKQGYDDLEKQALEYKRNFERTRTRAIGVGIQEISLAHCRSVLESLLLLHSFETKSSIPAARHCSRILLSEFEL